jgi:GNAT superfamily N-acetyltransferase
LTTTRPQILLDPTDDELTRAVEENLHELFRAQCTLADSELVEGPELSFHHTSPTSPMFKGVWATCLEPDAVEAAIDERIAWFRERDAPFFFWWTGPSSRPAELTERLLARGLIGMEEQSRVLVPGLKAVATGAPAMAADLRSMNEDALTQVPDGFVIEEVRDEAGLEGFRRVFVEAYEVPAFAAQAWVDATRALGIGRTPWRLFVGRLDGEAVATNMLFNGGGVASVYAVGTAPAARGRGIGGAITLAPLLEAREEGYPHAVLFSSAMGVHAYERIGFRLLDGAIDRYLWRAG